MFSSLLFLAAYPASPGSDAAALKALVDRARETGSDALVVMHQGRLVVDETFGKPGGRIEAMSATKSVVSTSWPFG